MPALTLLSEKESKIMYGESDRTDKRKGTDRTYKKAAVQRTGKVSRIGVKKLKLSAELAERMKKVGEQIKDARLSQNFPVRFAAWLADCSVATYYRIEQGNPDVAIGSYLKVLNALKLGEDILCLAGDERVSTKVNRIGYFEGRKRAGNQFRLRRGDEIPVR